MIQIKHRSTGKVIKEVDAASLVNADLRGTDLRGADLRGTDLRVANLQYTKLQDADLQDADLEFAYLRYANLRCANLRGANLRGADLRDADLQGAILQGAILQDTNLKDTNLQDTNLRWVLGDGKRIKTTIDRYRIVIMQEYGVMAIGCKQYSIDEWMNFSDEEINKMDTDALHWWKEGKPRIQQLIAG
jgi:uncharacterized protein YjbI with pentapeptide repeats